MNTSENGLNFIILEEGLKLKPYKDSVGVWTIGVGSTRWEDGRPVKGSDQEITKERAISLFKKRLKLYENAVNELVTSKINQNQFDALVSLCYNIGINGFKSSTVLKRVNNDSLNPRITDAFKLWKKAGNDKNALLNRRIRESELYFKKLFD